MWYICLPPHAAVGGSKLDLNSQKYRDEILESDVELARMPEHGAQI